MWTRFEVATEAKQGMVTAHDVEEAMRASNFNKGLGPDGFDGTILQPGNPDVKSVIAGDQFISERDQVNKAIAEYF